MKFEEASINNEEIKTKDSQLENELGETSNRYHDIAIEKAKKELADYEASGDIDYFEDEKYYEHLDKIKEAEERKLSGEFSISPNEEKLKEFDSAIDKRMEEINKSNKDLYSEGDEELEKLEEERNKLIEQMEKGEHEYIMKKNTPKKEKEPESLEKKETPAIIEPENIEPTNTEQEEDEIKEIEVNEKLKEDSDLTEVEDMLKQENEVIEDDAEDEIKEIEEETPEEEKTPESSEKKETLFLKIKGFLLSKKESNIELEENLSAEKKEALKKLLENKKLLVLIGAILVGASVAFPLVGGIPGMAALFGLKVGGILTAGSPLAILEQSAFAAVGAGALGREELKECFRHLLKKSKEAQVNESE